MKKPEKLEKYEESEKPEKYEKQKKQIRSSLSSSKSLGIQIRYYPGSSSTEFVAQERERRRIRHPNLASAPWRGENLSPKLGVRPVERGEERIRQWPSPERKIF